MTPSTSALATTEPIVITQYEVLLDDIKEARQNAISRFEYESKEGNRLARSYIFSLRKLRARIEDSRRKAKSWSLAYGREVDAQAKELSRQVDELIWPHQDAIDALARREAARVEAHQSRIDRISALGTVAFNATSAEIKEQLKLLDRETLDGLEEFEERAAAACVRSRQALVVALAKAEMAEAEAAELARFRAAEQERQQRENDAILAAEQSAAKAQARPEGSQTRAAEQEQRQQRQPPQPPQPPQSALPATEAIASSTDVLTLLQTELVKAMQGMDRHDVARAIARGTLHPAVKVRWEMLLA